MRLYRIRVQREAFFGYFNFFYRGSFPERATISDFAPDKQILVPELIRSLMLKLRELPVNAIIRLNTA